MDDFIFEKRRDFDPAGWFPETMDRFRIGLGTGMDAAGVGRQESPFRVVFSAPALTLRAYGEPGAAPGPTLLIVPAPIKRGYLWDLLPEASVVDRLRDAGCAVYLMYWESPGPDGQAFGLADYVDRLILESVRAIAAERETGPAVLLGHSLGGTLATLFAALFPKMVRGLVLLGAPLHFGADAGSLDLWLAATAMVRRGTRRPGEVAGSALAGGSLLADPLSFGWQRWWDEAVSFGDPDRHRVCLAVERWALDELPMPRPFFDDILESFYSRDAFLRGTLSIDGRTAGPDRVQSPLLAVVDPRCRLVPPAAVLPFLRAAIHAEIAVIEYVREAGVALHHVGMLVGREAHRTLWPKILDWLARLDPEHRAVNAGKPGST